MNKKERIGLKDYKRVFWSKKGFYLDIILLFSLILGSVFALKNDSVNTAVQETEMKEKKKTYEHMFPKRVSKNDFFKWEFILNDIASVYPRRSAIVRDILVDIGDEVRAWDTLAILFEPGVEWESNAKINVKSTLLQTKNNLLGDVLKVKSAKISEIEQKIKEKELILMETQNSFDSQINQVWEKNDDTWLWTEYKVQEQVLENLKKNLENALWSYSDLINNSEDNIVQKKELFDKKIEEIYLDIIPMVYIWSETTIDYTNINTYDISFLFWAKDTQTRDILITKIQNFQTQWEDITLEEKYNNLTDIQDLLIVSLKNTPISNTTSQTTISSYIWEIDAFYSTLVSQKELYEDAWNSLSIIETSQKEKIENLEEQIRKQENILALLESKSLVIESTKTLQLQKIRSEITTLEKSRDLLIANENKNITSIKNEIQVAKANLNREYISSSDYKIVSPFSWVISKRNVEIGQIISSNMEAFRMTGVETTLARITKQEVKFYVPESLKENVELGKEITFFLWDNENRSFTGSIYRISPEIDENNFSITVQAKVDESISLPNKTTLRVFFETKEEIFKIPSTSIYNKSERKIIYYKKENGKLWVKDVTIISDDWEYSLVSWVFDETLKIVTTPIFIK